MFYSNDPLADFNAYDAEQNRRLATLPVCADCDEPIQEDFAYYRHSEYICERCMDACKTWIFPDDF